MPKTADVTVTINLGVWRDNHKALIAARENVLELLEIYKEGPQTLSDKKHRAVEEMYYREKTLLEALIVFSTNNNGIPF